MTIQRVETADYYFVRKPHGIPTTFGSQFSFLEEIEQSKPLFFTELSKEFTKEEEFWLLNRLDNDTAGFIYFAKNHKVKNYYLQLQQEKKFTKYYIAIVAWKVDVERTVAKHPELLSKQETVSIPVDMRTIAQWEMQQHPDMQHISMLTIPSTWDSLVVTYPIMHHTHDDVRMVPIRIPKDEHKWRGEKHYVETRIIPVSYDEEANTTTCLIGIQQGIRHQIRAHLASVWYPIVWDILYGKNADTYLHLWSVWVKDWLD